MLGDKNYQIVSARGLFGPTSSWIYNLLRYTQPGLMLDVGAAAGEMAIKYLKANPESRVYAYEPYPGNWPHIEKSCGGDQRVRIVRKAISDKSGIVPFYVASAVAEDGAFGAGYSSVGFIGTKEGHPSIDVPAISLDEDVNEHVRFLKVDVQGGEAAVVRGAKQLLDRGMIDILCIEYDGADDAAILSLIERGYICFDTGYVVGATGGRSFDGADFEQTYIGTQSTGQTIYGGWPINIPRSPEAYCAYFHRFQETVGFLLTDLVFVRPAFMPQFWEAAAKMSEHLLAFYERSQRQQADAGKTNNTA